MSLRSLRRFGPRRQRWYNRACEEAPDKSCGAIRVQHPLRGGGGGVGCPRGGSAGIDLVSLVRAEKVVKGCYYGSARCQVDMPKMVELYQSGRLNLDDLITRRYDLDQINQAYGDLVRGGIGRGVIVFY